MSDQWRNELATEKQTEKLRFFGCTWDEGITAGQAGDALEECARQFPEAEATWQKNQPATEKQKEKLRYFGCTWSGDINVGQASDALLQCASDFPDKEADLVAPVLRLPTCMARRIASRLKSPSHRSQDVEKR
jgi:hypothetical protein